MSITYLANAVNVEALYAEQSLSLFMDLDRGGNTVAECRNSSVEDLPVTMSLTLSRVASLSERPHTSFSYARCEGGTGGDAVKLGLSGAHFLTASVNLSTFPDEAQRLDAVGDAATEHVLVDQSWTIQPHFRLSVRLLARAGAAWPLLQGPQSTETSFSRPPLTPRRAVRGGGGDGDAAEEGSRLDAYAPRFPSASQSTLRRDRALSLFDRSAPRSQLEGPVYMDQARFPIVRILFVPELYTGAVSTPQMMLRDMAIHVSVEKNKNRAHTASRRPARDHSKTVNVHVLDRVPASSPALDEESRVRLQGHDAICLAFDARKRRPVDSSASTYDVASAKRLVIDNFTFELTVTATRVPTETMESVQRAIEAYQLDEGIADVLDLNIDDVLEFIERRFSYMKDTTAIDKMSYQRVVWEAMRICLCLGATTDNDSNMDEFSDDENGINAILMNN